MSGEPEYEKKVLSIRCDLYYEATDPLFSGWTPPSPRNPERKVCDVELPDPLQYSIDYSNDRIKVTVYPQFVNGQCAQIIDAIFWAESEGSDVVYARANPACNPVNFEVGYGIGTYDNVNKYYYKSVTEWTPTWLDWTKTTTTRQRNNYDEATITYYYPPLASCMESRTKKIRLLDMTDATAECIDIRVKVGTVERVYRYNYMEAGNNFEKAKMLISLALMAHSNKRRVSFYGENYPNQSVVWKLKGLSVLD